MDAERPIIPRLHVVTDDLVLARAWFLEDARAVLRAGGARVALHVRGPATPGGPLLDAALALADEAARTGALLVVNDRVDVALAAGAGGVHLGARSLPVETALGLLRPGMSAGASVHGEETAAEAAAQGAAWVFAGTIYPTPSHPGREGRGPAFVARVAEAAPGVPVLAIGGVTPGRVAEVLAAGGAGAAVIRGVWDAPNPAAAVAGYLHELSLASRGGRGVDPHTRHP